MRIPLLFAFLILITGISAAGTGEPLIQARVDWQHDRITLDGEWKPGTALTTRTNSELRQKMREAMLRKLSTVVADLWRNASGNPGAVPEFSTFYGAQRLATFQVAQNRASATMHIALRGRDSLMAYMPLEFGSVPENLPVPQDPAYDRRATVGEYDNSETEPLLYTGVFIDARHLPFNPSLNAALFTDTGRQIYGAEFLTRVTAVRRGVSGYFASESAPAAMRRGGKRPLRVSALDVMREGGNGIVISEEDAQKLVAHEGSLRNLRRARVVILVAPDKLEANY